jgi:hypothetical protein
MVVEVLRLLAPAVGRDLIRPVEQLSVNAIALDQPMDVIPTPYGRTCRIRC